MFRTAGRPHLFKAGVLRSLFSSRWSSTIPPELNSWRLRPFYERTPPWWSRWTWVLLGCDVFMTGSACELTWNRWTRQVDVPAKSADTVDKVEGAYVLRPTWQRLALVLGQLTVGVGLGTMLIISRSRIVRRMHFLSPPKTPIPSTSDDSRQIFVQCVAHWRNRGRLTPLRDCRFDKGRDDTELILWIDGVRGHFWIGMEGVKIDGKVSSPLEARRLLMNEVKGVKTDIPGRWLSGPLS